jgi:hypothetical protein
MIKIFNEVRTYNWDKLLSDLTVAILATALSFLLERLKNANMADLGVEFAGGGAVALNWFKRIALKS